LGTLSDKNIIDQVNRICANADVKSKILLCRFLRFVVDETLAGRGDQIKGYTIGIEVLGKGKDFDPEQDSLVRIHAGRLRRLLKMYYLEDGRNDPVVIHIPKGSYQPQFLANSTWGIHTGEIYKIDTDEVELLHLEPTVTILPFKNLTGDSEKDYFAHGFSEEISIELTKYEDLKVINCWRRPEFDMDYIVNLYPRIGARFIIDGSIQLNDQKIKILVKLLDAVSGNQLWAERYQRDLSTENLIAIQEDISEEVAKTLGSEMGIVFRQLTEESARIRPDHFDVFNAILSFYYFEAHQSPELAIKTFHKLEQARTKNPNSGKIHAMLATLYGNSFALDFPENDGAFEKMAEHAERALVLDPNCQFVRIIYVYKCFLHNERDRFFMEADHCLSMNLNSPMRLGSIGFHLSLYGDWERGKMILDRAMNKHTGYPLYFHGATSLYHYRNNEYQKAFEEALKYDIPGLFWGPMLRAASLGQLNRFKKARQQIQHLKKLKPDSEDKAFYLIGRFVKEEDLVKNVIEGLKKAGMKIS